MISVRESCRLCGCGELQPVVTLGEIPLVNELIHPEDEARTEPRFPLDVVHCPSCSLVQLVQDISPEMLFGSYPYFSSYSEDVVNDSRRLAGQISRREALRTDDLVAEVASNDGYLLRHYLARGHKVLGIEPATNVAAHARDVHGIPTLPHFFTREVAESIRSSHGACAVVHANNVLAHVEDLNDFAAGLRVLLKEDGVLIVEVPHVVDLVETGAFDTIYHEHRCYFSLTSLQKLFAKVDLVIEDVDHFERHGGSLRISCRPGSSAVSPGERVEEMLDDESRWGVESPKTYRRLQDRMERVGESLGRLLESLRADGSRVAAYGASAKGVVLLTTCGIGKDLIDYVIDRNPHKQGRLLPGAHLEIRSTQVLAEQPPDYLLLLAWNFAGEIMRQQASYLALGGRMIIPIPEPHIAPRLS